MGGGGATRSVAGSCLCSGGVRGRSAAPGPGPGVPEPHLLPKVTKTKSDEEKKEVEEEFVFSAGHRSSESCPHHHGTTTAIKIIQFHSGAAQLSTLCKSRGGRWKKRWRQPVRFPGMYVAKIIQFQILKENTFLSPTLNDELQQRAKA